MSVWIIVAIVVALVGTGAGLRVRSNRRLAKPWLGGVPLPSPNDPRWEADARHPDYRAHLGRFAVSVDYYSGSRVSFEDEVLGNWRRYVRTVLDRLAAQRREAQAERALAAIVDDPSTPAAPREGR